MTGLADYHGPIADIWATEVRYKLGPRARTSVRYQDDEGRLIFRLYVDDAHIELTWPDDVEASDAEIERYFKSKVRKLLKDARKLT